MSTEDWKEELKRDAREFYKRKYGVYVLYEEPSPISKDYEYGEYYLKCIEWEKTSYKKGWLRRYKG